MTSPQSLLDYLEANRDRYLEELLALLRIPSVSTDPAHTGDVARCAQAVAARLSEAGLENVQTFPTARHPILYADWLHAGADAPTVLVYGHYDVQPPDPLHLWRSGPFEPVIEGGKLIARGASDDKGQFYCHVKGVEAHLKRAGSLPVNVKFLIEGEEEIGSPNLAPFIAAHRDLLAASAVIISDTHMIGPDSPAITYGLRGLAYIEVHAEGPSHDLHSGNYGGGIENPLLALCALVSSLKDADGRITIPGFYDDAIPLTDDERAMMAALPFDDAAWLASTGAPKLHGEPGFTTLERITARPTLDLCGMWGGFQGDGAKTVLPSKAGVKLSMRLVPGQDPEKITQLVIDHIERSAPATVRVKAVNLHGGDPVLVPRDNPSVQAACRAYERAFQKAPVFMRSGGSIPVVASFLKLLNAPSVLMGFGLSDDLIHSPNEKLDLSNYFRGITASACLWEELAK
jgi:acetylornithine deacetylase/succinyl-diaminopimelate desuccinylase-like protein